jgi:peptide deformylase
MAVREILTYPDPTLRHKSKPVEDFGAATRETVADVIDTMNASPGVGLAAIQIGVNRQIIAINIQKKKPLSELLVLINPAILKLDNEFLFREGCLSVPQYTANITRYKQCSIEASDAQGKRFKLECEGLLAVAVQHEIDHLTGKLFIDRIQNVRSDLFPRKKR